MKKILLLVIAAIGMQTAIASDSANIKIKINGATNNRYFLCMSGVGCLSILAGQQGKVYPIFRDVNLSTMYVMDTSNRKLSVQTASSCAKTVPTNKTVTISGSLSGGSINRLNCRIT